MKEIVRKVALYDVTQVATTDYKLPHASGGKNLHDVPKNRHTTDFNHRLRPEMALFTDSGTHAACENHGLQSTPPENKTMT